MSSPYSISSGLLNPQHTWRVHTQIRQQMSWAGASLACESCINRRFVDQDAQYNRRSWTPDCSTLAPHVTHAVSFSCVLSRLALQFTLAVVCTLCFLSQLSLAGAADQHAGWYAPTQAVINGVSQSVTCGWATSCDCPLLCTAECLEKDIYRVLPRALSLSLSLSLSLCLFVSVSLCSLFLSSPF